jgi:uncharacterized protein (DUF1778 family)
MSRGTQSKKAVPAPEAVDDPAQKDTVTFSVRLSEAQKDLITKAAELRGWTPTNLLRVAALEKAAYIVNTSTLTKVDFKSLAATVSNQIFAPRLCRVVGQYGEVVHGFAVESLNRDEPWGADEHPVEVSPWSMPSSFVEEFKEAARFGGTEFLELILAFSEDIVSRTERILPNPIDPTKL